MRYNNRQNPPTHPSRSAPTPSDAASDSVAAARTAPHPSQAMTYRSRGRASQPSEVRRSGSTYAIMKARHATSETACPTIGQARRPPRGGEHEGDRKHRAEHRVDERAGGEAHSWSRSGTGAFFLQSKGGKRSRCIPRLIVARRHSGDRLSDTRQLDDAVAPLVRS